MKTCYIYIVFVACFFRLDYRDTCCGNLLALGGGTMTKIIVNTTDDGKITPKTITFDKPFEDITASEIMSRTNCNNVGWEKVETII